jgi:hypothetical protein
MTEAEVRAENEAVRRVVERGVGLKKARLAVVVQQEEMASSAASRAGKGKGKERERAGSGSSKALGPGARPIKESTAFEDGLKLASDAVHSQKFDVRLPPALFSYHYAPPLLSNKANGSSIVNFHRS